METANSDTFRTPSSHKNININIYLFIYMMFYVDISLNVCVRTFPCTSIIVEAITIIMDPTHKSTSTNLHLLLPVNVSKDNNVLCPVPLPPRPLQTTNSLCKQTFLIMMTVTFTEALWRIEADNAWDRYRVQCIILRFESLKSKIEGLKVKLSSSEKSWRRPPASTPSHSASSHLTTPAKNGYRKLERFSTWGVNRRRRNVNHQCNG